MKASNEQKAKIKMLQKSLGISQSNYKELLWQGYKVESSTKLDAHQARELIYDLTEQAVKAGVWEKRTSPVNKLKYNELADRPGFATPAQLRMLNAMWHTSDKVRNKTDEAFENFVATIAKVQSIKWLRCGAVQKVKLAIERLA